MPKPPVKRERNNTELDPVVDTVRDLFEQNVQYFLDNIGSYVDKYQTYQNNATSLIESQPKISAAPSTTTTAAADNNPPSAFDTTATPKSVIIGGKVSINPTADETVVEVEFPDNSDLKQQLKQLKREAYEMSTTLEGIVDWIDLNAPDKVKGQEDAGAEIQGAVSEQIASLAAAVNDVYELELKYLGERAELETTLLALPEVKSIALSMEIHDAETWDTVERSWKVMVRVCLIAYSVVTKNLARLKQPVATRSSGSIYQ